MGVRRSWHCWANFCSRGRNNAARGWERQLRYCGTTCAVTCRSVATSVGSSSNPPLRPANTKFTAAITKWARLWRTPALPKLVQVTFSGRMRRSVGRVRPRTGAITLSEALLAAPRPVLLEVLCHETAHVSAFLLHGPRAKPHGAEWRELVRRAGYEPSTSIRSRWLEPATPKTRPRRIRYRCPVCQSSYLVSRSSSRLHCGACLHDGVTVSLIRIG